MVKVEKSLSEIKNKIRMPAITISIEHPMLEVLAIVVRGGKKKKWCMDQKKERKFSLFTDDSDNVHLKIQSDLFYY